MPPTLKQILAKLKPGDTYLSPDKKVLYVSTGHMKVESFFGDFSNWTEAELKEFVELQTHP